MSDELLRNLVRQAQLHGTNSEIVAQFMTEMSDDELREAYLSELKRRNRIVASNKFEDEYWAGMRTLCEACQGEGCSLCDKGSLENDDFPDNFYQWCEEKRIKTTTIEGGRDRYDLVNFFKDITDHLLILTKIDYGNDNNEYGFLDLGPLPK